MDSRDQGRDFDQGRPRGKPSRRNATDIGTTYVHFLHDRKAKGRGTRGFEAERDCPSYVANILPPAARRTRAVDTIPAKHLHSSFNKLRQPVNVVRWTPEGRRLLCGDAEGHFTLWNGTGFNFETINSHHASAIRAIQYAHSGEWIISSDHNGVVKYFQPNFNPVNDIQAHGDAVRGLCFSPNDAKFVTASDDASLKIWDFATGMQDSQLTGHQWDAKCVDWHPSKGLIVSGSKDHQVKLWDPRSGRCLTTLHGHKNTVNMTKFEPSRGTLLASCARDQTVRIFDLHMMRDVFLLRGNEKEVNSLVWHPFHSNLLSTGGADGALYHYLLDEQHPPPGTPLTIPPYDAPNPADAPAQTIYPAHKIQHAHEYNIWTMDWHPMGHILASGSNDRATRFWTRPRPGDSHTIANDKWHIGQAAAEAKGTWGRKDELRAREEEEADDDADGLEDQNPAGRPNFLPGLAGGFGSGLPGLATSAPPSQVAEVLNPNQFPSNIPLPMPANLPPGMDMETLRQAAQAFQQQQQQGGGMPGMPPGMPPGFPPMPAGMPPMPAGFVPPPGFPPMPPGMPPMPGMANGAAGGGGGVRKRAPLPSQQDSLMAEMKQGKWQKPR
ncbi:unnamed protein product [Zymoseptoria tritici ST99CH_3D7]|uniref:Polyadenylation factor subunit 2 n=2 Tax=Zymoseptoria tritici TaxID=1047171 RepID=F9X6G4_ZYMTI|nr:uncharacterized protein MYCGRDRAFT_57284 [Zymoseptoria tritici IPO323]EGP89039.1 hypothetical protein MYCGRDRAFT_57284 [Zymoseptoria tritici IPO323]SMQ49292.1 unnamed protein product [Zymoseptoria tritici ST99CH_3D7]